MQLNNEIQGLNMELAIRAARELGLQYKPELLPWKRALQQAYNYPNTLLVGLARTPEREDKFNWITPVFQSHIGFISLRSQTVEPSGYRAKTCVHSNTPMEHWLKQTGDKDYIAVSNEKRCLHLLSDGIVSQWFTEVNLARYIAENNTPEAIKLRSQKIILSPELYIATSKSNTLVDISAWKKTLSLLIEQGVLTELENKYLAKSK